MEKRSEDTFKNRKKKNKKNKSIIKTILKLLLLIILIAIISYACYFGYNYSKITTTMGEREYDPLSATALGIDPEKLKDVGRINILLLGESDANQNSEDPPYYLTDTIMVVSYNPQTQQASIFSIPRDTYVGKKDKKSASQNYLASYKMNSMYRNRQNIEQTVELVSDLIDLNIDYYVLVDTVAIKEIVDAIGGVEFEVPIDMDYEDGNQDLYIHLEAGMQHIDGDKAEQLLRFRHNQDGTSYPEEYGDNDVGRMRTQREFIKETAKQLFRLENATKIIDLANIAFNNIRTNMDFETIKYYVPYAFKFNPDNIIADTLPGTNELCNGVWIYSPNKEEAVQLAKDLFTDKIIKDEIEITEEQLEGKITIELLSGIDNQALFDKSKEELKSKGYLVIKSGTTIETSKTTIVNRRGNPKDVSNEVKDAIGVGNIINGSDNADVDYTIIIGEDYK